MAIQCNVGGGDKAFRIVLGLVLIVVALVVEMTTPLKIVTWIVAAIALATAFMGFCPLNRMIGLNTCKPKVG